MQYLIRLMTIEDYDEVYAMWLSCKGMGLNDRDDSQEGIERFLKRNPTTNFVAVSDGRIIGCILGGHDGRRGHIHHTAVSPEFRGHGIGKALVNAVLDAFTECGIGKVCFVVFNRNEVGNAFWERLGFKQRTDLTYRDKALVEFVRTDT